MFERYNEKARRVIFFARYEASQRNSAYIEPVDLLLGALREDTLVKTALTRQTTERLVAQLRSRKPESERPTASSVDLPLNRAARQALASGAEEAESLKHKTIAPGHLVIGVLLQRDDPAAAALEAVGFGLDRARDLVTQAGLPSESRPPSVTPRAARAAASSLSPLLASLHATVSTPIQDASQPIPGLQEYEQLWTRKEVLGHLIDLAMAHQQWIAGALAQGKLHASNMPDKTWVDAQRYVDDDWQEMVDLWLRVNRHLLNVIAAIPEEKLSINCQIGDSAPVSLEGLISSYVHVVAKWVRRLTHGQA